MYKEFFSLVQKCMELSFNSVVQLINRIERVGASGAAER